MSVKVCFKYNKAAEADVDRFFLLISGANGDQSYRQLTTKALRTATHNTENDTSTNRSFATRNNSMQPYSLSNKTITYNDIAVKLNILVVDDAISILKITTLMLKRQGHVVETAEDGQVALNKIALFKEKNKRFDVILMDLQMPGMF